MKKYFDVAIESTFDDVPAMIDQIDKVMSSY